MDGLECSEILFSQIDLGDRFDSDYYTKNYLHISDQMSKVPTEMFNFSAISQGFLNRQQNMSKRIRLRVSRTIFHGYYAK